MSATNYSSISGIKTSVLSLFMGIILCILYSCNGNSPRHQNSQHCIDKGKEAVENGDFGTAAVYFDSVYALYQDGDNGDAVPEALEFGGNVHAMSGNYVKALDFYICATEAAERNDNTKVYAYCHNNIALIYALFGNYKKASRYLETACDMATQINDTNLLGIAATNLVRATTYTGETDKASKYFKLQEQHPLRNKERQKYYLLFNKGLINCARKDYGAGIAYLKQALSQASSLEDSQSLATDVYTELGRIYTTKGLNDSAAYYLTKVISGKASPENQMTAYKMLAELPHSDKTIDYQSQYIALSDSVFNRSQFDSMCDKLFILEKTRTDNQTKALQHWIVILSVIIFSILAVLTIMLLYHKKLKAVKTLLVKKNQQLIEKNDQLEHTLTQISEKKEPELPEVSSGETSEPPTEPEHKASQQIKLSDEKQDELRELIEHQLSDISNIQNQDYSLSMLAQQIGSNTRYVSYVINTSFKKTFKTLLNEYRIRESCRRLTDPKEYSQLTIAAIAQSVGYNSVNNFINIFKKINGVTPSQYRKLANSTDTETVSDLTER